MKWFEHEILFDKVHWQGDKTPSKLLRKSMKRPRIVLCRSRKLSET
jgi:hypothetical protein